MKRRDFYQRVKAPGQGQEINASDLNKIVALILQCVKGGRGIQVERVGQSVIIKATGGGAGGGSFGTGWNNFYDATTKAGLDNAANVPEKSFGRVTAGSQKGMVCVPNPDRDGWDALNFFE